MVGVFSESLGSAYEGLLESMGVAAVWRSPAAWHGTDRAMRAGCCATFGVSGMSSLLVSVTGDR
jgi:hypothetical protein